MTNGNDNNLGVNYESWLFRVNVVFPGESKRMWACVLFAPTLVSTLSMIYVLAFLFLGILLFLPVCNNRYMENHERKQIIYIKF